MYVPVSSAYSRNAVYGVKGEPPMRARIGKSTLWRRAKRYVVIILAPMLILTALLYASKVQNDYTMQVSNSERVLDTVEGSVNTNRRLVENVIQALVYEDELIELLSNTRQSDFELVIRQLFSVQKILARSSAFMSDLDTRVVLFSGNSRVPLSYWYILSTEQGEEMSDYRKFIDSGSNCAWMGEAPLYPASTVINPQDNQMMLGYYMKVNLGVNHCVGVVKCGVPKRKLFSAIESGQLTNCMFVRSGDDVVFGTAPSALSGNVPLVPGRQIVNNYICMVRPLESLGMDLVMYLDDSDVKMQVLVAALPMLIASLLSAALIIVFTLAFLGSVQRRMDQITSIAQEARNGRMDITLPDKEDDELSSLVDTFNALLAKLERNATERINHEKNERKALQMALQYQVNPHFLFNTLNWLHMSAEMQVDYKQLSAGIVALSRLLRYNLDDNASATIREELENTRTYVRLINLRKQNLVSLEEDLEGVDMDQPVMRFLFQPICENAVQHGLRPGFALHVRITGRDDGGDMRFTVENDGMMIEAERIAQLQDSIQNGRFGNGVGLANIAARLRLLYGEQAEVRVTSTPGHTTVAIRYSKNMQEG